MFLKTSRFLFCVMFSFPFFLHAKALTPDKAFQMLLDGNTRFIAGKTSHPNLTSERYDEMKMAQEPFAIIIGCSDSRVPPEMIFDQGLGDLFVVRDAGNVVGPIELDSIEYGVFRLHVPLILVLGHENCGAIKAALSIKDGAKMPDIQHIYPLIKPSLQNLPEKTDERLVRATKNNIQYNIGVIKKDPRIAKLISENKLKVIGGYYDLDDCKVMIFSP